MVASHKAANFETHGKDNDGGLDVCIRVEIDQHDKEGKTEPYGLTIPALNYEAGKFGTNAHSHHLRHHRSRPDTAGAASSFAPSTAPSLPVSAPEAGHHQG